MNDLSFWSQGWWQSVGVITSVILGVIAILLTILQSKKKRLDYKVLYSEALLNVDKQVKSDLKITYKGHEVEQINVFKLQIINNGKIPIKKNDFEGPLEIELKNAKNIFNIEMPDCQPDNLNINFDHVGNKILINPMLINPNDFFNLQITFDGQDREFSILARIEGVEKIAQMFNEFDRIDYIKHATYFLVYIALLCIVFLFFSDYISVLLIDLIKFSIVVLFFVPYITALVRKLFYQ